MRRGHPGRGGWRNDGSRNFRPRTGGAPGFRPPRGFPPSLLDTPRFPPPPRGPRFQFRGPPSFINRPGHQDEDAAPQLHHRDKYQILNRQLGQRTQDQSHHYPQSDDYSEDIDDRDMYSNQSARYHVNSMGDVDQRALPFVSQSRPDSFQQQEIPLWATRTGPRTYSRHDDVSHEAQFNKMPQQDYTGHRPPSSDHYDKAGPPVESDSFTRSVGDTVDIIRRRLQNRNDPQNQSTPLSTDPDIDESRREPIADLYQQQAMPQVQVQRKKPQRPRNIKANCDKIKNNIVHQLFKMDKDRIHKLMDNPNSSSKFEYAINSLITESQNNYNRHMRSAAEQSLCVSRNEIMQYNETDTIYEDTFMKQMQCILEPQDTVFLEDIKPFVMAELKKVLQLNEFDQNAVSTEEVDYQNYEENRPYGVYPNYGGDCQSDPQYYEAHSSFTEPPPFTPAYDRSDNHVAEAPVDYGSESSHYEDTSSLFERRGPRKSIDYNRNSRKSSTESRHAERIRRSSSSVDIKPSIETPVPYVDGNDEKFSERKRRSSSSIDKKSFIEAPAYFDTNIDQVSESRSAERKRQSSSSVDKANIEPTPAPYFDPNPDQFSDEEDPFAELDKQYHVAVDHNFIEAEDPTMPEYLDPPKNSSRDDKANDFSFKDSKTNQPSHKISIKKEKRHNSKPRVSLELLENSKELPDDINILTALESHIKTELMHCEEPPNTVNENLETTTKDIDEKPLESIKKEKLNESKEDTQKSDSSNTSLEKSSQHSNSRKRSTEQRPSHRKEKRKKSEGSPVETNKQILNKNIIINLNDCASKKSENCDAKTSGKSIFNLFFSKGQTETEDSKKNEGTDSGYSEKYVKRKESPQKPYKERGIENKKRDNSSSSNHSAPASKDSKDSHSNANQTPTKSDSKKKLKSIDIFTEQPRKSAANQAIRNTASSTSVVKTPSITHDEKFKTIPIKSISKQVIRRHVATQVTRKLPSKECQTNESKSSTSRFCQTIRRVGTKAVQTDPVSLEKLTKPKATDAFERMKEIDMEIQILLQEKFKLYNNLESNESHQSSMQNLGMTVLTTNDDSTDSNSADNIVDDFTNIPEDELEQIALETVEHDETLELRTKKKKTRRQQLQESPRKGSQSPKTSKKKKSRTPNISLLEQIITDDRPLEDIISLDDLETSPVRTKASTKNNKKSSSRQNTNITKKKKKKPQPKTLADIMALYDIKPCSVVLLREDLNRLLLAKKEIIEANHPKDDDNNKNDRETRKTSKTPEFKSQEEHAESKDVEEESVNDFQFQVDMLDVCEDILIDSNCDTKTDDAEIVTMPVCEEIVLDNSQSGEEMATVSAVQSQLRENCKMYDYSADEDLKQDSVSITGNGDAVLAIECIESNFLAACLDGNVYYFSGDGALLATLRGSNLAVTCLTIVSEKYGTTVYTGSLDSRIRYYDLETGMERGPECNVLSPIQTMDRAWDTVFVGTRTGFVLQFECKNNMLIPVSTIKFSEQSILALRALKEGPRKVLLVASRSENVTIKDAQTGLLLRTLEGPKMTVYTLLYEEGKVYCGTSSNQIQVFDYASGTHCGEHDGGKGAVCLRAAGGVLFAGCYDGCVYAYRGGERRPFAQLRGPGVMLLSLAVVGSNIIVGYKDRSLYIWKIPDNILQEMVL